ncbi:L-ascorbate oxidase -like protein [Capsicum baccatum]|uniref:L-ascorbate oxidase-like protein n=1 Tax=Capsicum baccatum TaxID=33114 RepID=A0A2G2UUW9_CAPBA|nr:L-ascorbate oxidase -like protein [Capsicum baccatum]
MNQFRSYRWNLTASAARPNPQGSYHYGKINITRTLKIVNTRSQVDGKLRFSLNGISHANAETPFKLAEYFGVGEKVFKYDLMSDEPSNTDKAHRPSLSKLMDRGDDNSRQLWNVEPEIRYVGEILLRTTALH